jgi:hypothetical protein
MLRARVKNGEIQPRGDTRQAEVEEETGDDDQLDDDEGFINYYSNDNHSIELSILEGLANGTAVDDESSDSEESSDSGNDGNFE